MFDDFRSVIITALLVFLMSAPVYPLLFDRMRHPDLKAIALVIVLLAVLLGTFMRDLV